MKLTQYSMVRKAKRKLGSHLSQREAVKKFGCDLTVTDTGRLGNQIFEYLTLVKMVKEGYKGSPCISIVRKVPTLSIIHC